MTQPNPTQSLHEAYVRLTGRDLTTLDYIKEQAWFIWSTYRKHEPFTVADLELVVRFLKEQIRKGERKPACLKFRNLIAQPDWFEDDLQDARAYFRKPKPNPSKASVLAATGRPTEQPQQDAKRVDAIVQQCLADFRKAVT